VRPLYFSLRINLNEVHFIFGSISKIIGYDFEVEVLEILRQPCPSKEHGQSDKLIRQPADFSQQGASCIIFVKDPAHPPPCSSDEQAYS
jgi:hypothetical protein